MDREEKRQKMDHDAVIELVRKIEDIDPEARNLMWLQLIKMSKWTFEDAMEFVTEAAARRESKIAAFLSASLASSNEIWKHWFFMQFPDFVRDLKLDPAVADAPFPWMYKSRQYVLDNPDTMASPDDHLFEHVIWRSCFMWAYMFRRRCGKYYADFLISIEASKPEGELKEDTGYRTRNDVKVKEYEGETQITIPLRRVDASSSPRYMYLRYTDMFENTAWGKYTSIPIKTWAAWQRYLRVVFSRGLERTEVRKIAMSKHYRISATKPKLGFLAFGVHPDVGKERYDVLSGKFGYNFGPHQVEAFVRWYLYEMAGRHWAPFTDDDEFTEWALMDEDVIFDTKKQRWEKVTLLWGSIVRGIVDWDEGDINGTQWSVLERLPLCPRRIDTRDPDKRAVQFLGARELEGK